MKLSGKSRAAFGFGAFGKDVVYMLISGYMLYYYNVVLGISSVCIGGMMMAARIFDALNDPFMGIIVAKTKTRWGRFRPWIFTGTVLNAVVIYALFSAPSSASNEGLVQRLLCPLGRDLHDDGHPVLVDDSGDHGAGEGPRGADVACARLRGCR